MKYLAVRCRSCEKEFAVGRIEGIQQAVRFLQISFKASYACPYCGATGDYASVDLIHYDGDVETGPLATSRGNVIRATEVLASKRLGGREHWEDIATQADAQLVPFESSPSSYPLNRAPLLIRSPLCGDGLPAYHAMAKQVADPDEILLRFNRLMRDLVSGRIHRNTFQPWEIELLLDIEGCQLTERTWEGVLRRYQRAVRRQIEKGATAPMKLSEFLASKR